MRDTSYPLVPVEEIEAELEKRWYTLEEQVQAEMMMERDGGGNSVSEESKGGEGPS